MDIVHDSMFNEKIPEFFSTWKSMVAHRSNDPVRADIRLRILSMWMLSVRIPSV